MIKTELDTLNPITLLQNITIMNKECISKQYYIKEMLFMITKKGI